MTRPGTTLLQGTVAYFDEFRPKSIRQFAFCNNNQITRLICTLKSDLKGIRKIYTDFSDFFQGAHPDFFLIYKYDT